MRYLSSQDVKSDKISGSKGTLLTATRDSLYVIRAAECKESPAVTPVSRTWRDDLCMETCFLCAVIPCLH